eukprot:m.71222 g.71222  ORF g.71222 m.71222 type:complete len:198 (+) comp16894_c0_seq1:250-843(+)
MAASSLLGLRRMFVERVQHAWARYNVLLVTHPIRTKATTALIVMSTGDGMRQHIETREQGVSFWSAYDWKRTVRFSVYYAAVHVPWINCWYGILNRVVGVPSTLRNTVVKTLADQLLNMPVLAGLMLFNQALLAGRSVEEAKAKVQRDHWELVKGVWVVWIPALTVIFGTVPDRLRILAVNAVQVGFSVYMSKMANK